jgi:hypothetical protein
MWAVPMSAGAAELVVPLDGGINAGVTTSLHSGETVDVHSQGFVGTPLPLSQSAHALSGSLSSQYVEGHATVAAAWTSPDRGTIAFQLDGAMQASCCGNSVYTSPTYLDDWHYTFVPTTNAVFRLRSSITSQGAGTCGFRVYVNGVFSAGLEAPDDGTTLTELHDFPLTAGQATTLALDNCMGFSTTASTLTGFVASGHFSFEILPPDPGPAFTALLDEVKGLDINEGTRGALQRKLENALAAVARGDVGAAGALLGAFINAVEAQRNRTLTDAQADALIEAAQALIDSLLQA